MIADTFVGDTPERPGAYLRSMREAAGLTLPEAARLIELLGFATGRAGPWFRYDVPRHLACIEADKRRPTAEQLLVLTIVFPFRLARYRELAEALESTTADAA